MELAGQFTPDDDEFAPRDDPSAFAEGMTVHVNDPDQSVSLLCALYATLGERDQSWHNLSVNFPDGRVASTIEFAPLHTGESLRSGNLCYEQVVPFTQWRYGFDGTVDYARQEDTLRPDHDRERGLLSFDLEVECATPAWAPPATVFGSGAGAESGVKVFGFYVQNLRFSGWVRDDHGAQWDLKGTGWRHHVRSQPWGGAILGHSFIHVLFPSGRAFGLQWAETTAGDSSGFGYLFDGRSLHQAGVRSITKWDRLVFCGEPIEIVLERDDGQTVRITGETLNNVATINLSDRPRPADLSDPDGLLTLFGDTRWTWDGETGYGTWERTKVVKALR